MRRRGGSDGVPLLGRSRTRTCSHSRPLVDRRAGGIATDVLTDAVRGQGWRTAQVAHSLDALAARVHDGQPVIVLLPDRGNRYHYVVVTAVDAAAIVVHDPSWGPSRSIRAPDFERAWQAARYWSLVILPGDTGKPSVSLPPAPVASDPPDPANMSCDARLNRALETIRERGVDAADALLAAVRTACPDLLARSAN